jgi:hypothetical protein
MHLCKFPHLQANLGYKFVSHKLSECRRQSPPNRGASEKFMTANDQAMKIRKLEERNSRHDPLAQQVRFTDFLYPTTVPQDSPDNDHPAALKASTVEETVNLTGNFPVNELRMKDLIPLKAILGLVV